MLVEPSTADVVCSATVPGRVARTDSGAVEESGTRAVRPIGQARLLPRRTFTVEVWVSQGHVVATQVVHLQTQDADAWYGWDPARLVGFLADAVGLASAPPSGAGPDGGTPERTVPAVPSGTAVDDPASASTNVNPWSSPPSALTVHRYGMLTAAGLKTGGGEVAARLRLDPVELDLPAGCPAQARVELVASPVGAGRSAPIATRVIDLDDGRRVDVTLRGRLPTGRGPCRILATVRVLARQAGGRPREGLGGATLEIVPAG